MFDFLKTSSLKILINSHKDVKRVAEVLDITLKNGDAYLKVLLKGETEPVTVTLNYKIISDTLYIKNVKTSKDWLNSLADMFKDKYAEVNLGKYERLAGIAKHIL
jgi:hypothetical protein